MTDRQKSLHEERNKLMNQAAEMSRKPDITAEQRATVERMLADVDRLEGDIKLEERFSKFEEEQRSFNAPPRPNPGSGNADTVTMEMRSKREKKAFEQYVRFGEGAIHPELRHSLRSSGGLTPEELRDLGVGTPTGALTGGQQFVPQGFDPQLIQAQKAWGELLDLVTIRRTSNGAPVKFAYSNDTGAGLQEIAEITGSPTEQDPSLAGAISSTLVVSTGWVKVSIQELQDSAFDIDGFIRDIFGKRWFRGAVAKMTSGSTDGTTVQSIVAGAYAAATTASDTAIGYEDLVAIYGAQDPAYMPNSNWSMNSNTRSKIMGLTDTLGRPLFLPSTASGAPDTILGRPVTINQSLANIPTSKGANIVPVQFGDFKQGYRFRIVNGEVGGQMGDLSIIRANELFIGGLEVGFMGFGRIGGNVTDAGTHPILNLVMADV